MRALQPWHLIVLLVVVLVLFGGKRLPDAARGLGRSMRIFKSEIKQMKDEDEPAATSPAAPVEGRVVDEFRPTQPSDASTAERQDGRG